MPPIESATEPEHDLVMRLRAGDERAFELLVGRHHRLMVQVAKGYVRSDEVAEDVVQETWLAVVRGIRRFEGRSSVKTWLLRIVANRAMTRGAREARSVPFSALEGDDDESAVAAERFRGAESADAGAWASPPPPWPQERVLSGELRDVVSAAIGELPGLQRIVVSLRDVEGWSSEEVCEALELSAVHQRVLLHRGRARVRGAIEEYVA